jgi:hypothetical protein
MTLWPRHEWAVTLARRLHVLSMTVLSVAARGVLATGFAALAMQVPPATAAEPLVIAGNYGNEAGCRTAAGGVADSEDLLMLTPREVGTYATLCGFVQLLPGGDVDLVATVTCGHEGEDLITLGLMRLRKEEGRDAFTIYDDQGNSWGTVERCPAP